MPSLGLAAYRFSIAWPRVQPGGTRARERARPRLLPPARRRAARGRDRALPDALPLGPAAGAAGRRRLAGARHRVPVRRVRGARARRARRPGQPLADAERAVVRRVPRLRARAARAGSSRRPRGGRRRAPPDARPRALRRADAREVGARASSSRSSSTSSRTGRRRRATADVAAARLVDGMHNRIFLDPILRGAYPEDVLAHLEPLVGLGHIQDGDLETISTPLDLLGVNYYRPGITAARTEPAPGLHALAGRRVGRGACRRTGEQTTMGWVVDPGGLEELLLRLGADYGGLPLLDHRERRVLRRPGRARRERPRPGPGRVPRRPPPRRPPRARGRSRPARLLRLVAARQLRVGGGLQQALRRRPRRLRDSPSDAEGERPLVCPRDLGGRARRRRTADGEVGAGRARVAPDPGGGRRPRRRLAGDGLARHQQLAEGER